VEKMEGHSALLARELDDNGMDVATPLLTHAWIVLHCAFACAPPLGLAHVRGRLPKIHTGLQRFAAPAGSTRRGLAR
jgi:hypothetical protein